MASACRGQPTGSGAATAPPTTCAQRTVAPSSPQVSSISTSVRRKKAAAATRLVASTVSSVAMASACRGQPTGSGAATAPPTTCAQRTVAPSSPQVSSISTSVRKTRRAAAIRVAARATRNVAVRVVRRIVSQPDTACAGRSPAPLPCTVATGGSAVLAPAAMGAAAWARTTSAAITMAAAAGPRTSVARRGAASTAALPMGGVQVRRVEGPRRPLERPSSRRTDRAGERTGAFPGLSIRARGPPVSVVGQDLAAQDGVHDHVAPGAAPEAGPA